MSKPVVFITSPCPRCHSTEYLSLPHEEYQNLIKNQMLIQRAAPSLTAAQRERLITGYCDPCYKALTSEDEDNNV